MGDKFLEFVNRYIFGFKIKNVLIGLGVIILGIIGYFVVSSLIADATITPAEAISNLKYDASTISQKVLAETNYIVLGKEIPKKTLVTSEMQAMGLIGKYSEVSYYTKKVNDTTYIYITLIGKDKYSGYQLSDYQL